MIRRAMGTAVLIIFGVSARGWSPKSACESPTVFFPTSIVMTPRADGACGRIPPATIGARAPPMSRSTAAVFAVQNSPTQAARHRPYRGARRLLYRSDPGAIRGHVCLGRGAQARAMPVAQGTARRGAQLRRRRLRHHAGTGDAARARCGPTNRTSWCSRFFSATTSAITRSRWKPNLCRPFYVERDGKFVPAGPFQSSNSFRLWCMARFDYRKSGLLSLIGGAWTILRTRITEQPTAELPVERAINYDIYKPPTDAAVARRLAGHRRPGRGNPSRGRPARRSLSDRDPRHRHPGMARPQGAGQFHEASSTSATCSIPTAESPRSASATASTC